MIIAISSTENHPNAKIDKHFGRCGYIVFYNSENGSTEYIPNPYKSLIEGAGPALCELINSKKVNKVISGNFGQKVKDIFDSYKIQLILLKDENKTINDIIKLIENS
jgi:predicted Fe-Mo cluster-binding NifX family protein